MYIIEGNIGVGKSTFLKLLQQVSTEIDVVYEPLHHWESQDYNQSLLVHFYEQPHRWAYTMEMRALMCRVRDHRVYQDTTQEKTLIERSLYSGYYCFALNGYHSDFMTEAEWRAYTAWFNFFVPRYCKPPRGFIYLRTDPFIAYERIAKRKRASEGQITLQYLKRLHNYHEDFLIHRKNIISSLRDIPVLILDAQSEFEHDTLIFAQYIKSLRSFMQQTGKNSVANDAQERIV